VDFKVQVKCEFTFLLRLCLEQLSHLNCYLVVHWIWSSENSRSFAGISRLVPENVKV